MDASSAHPHNGGPSGIDTVEHLVEHLREIVCDETVIVCVGNTLQGDDGAGVAVARELSGKVPWDVFDTQMVPESFLMKIAARKPKSVILIDALHFGGSPGAVELVEPKELTGQGPSTHGPAPLAFLEILQMLHPSRVAILGIEPQQIDLDAPLSAPVQTAVQMITQAFLTLAESASGPRRGV